jgi:hypothetical protein
MNLAKNGYGVHVTPKVDVYNSGVLLLELLVRKWSHDPIVVEFEHIVPSVLATMKQNGPNLNDDVFNSMLHDMTIDL